MLIAVCMFKMIACKSCSPNEGTASDTGQTPIGQSVVFTRISQAINFHGATVVQYIPPYSAQEGIGMNFHQVLSHPGIPPFSRPLIPALSPPCYYNVNPLKLLFLQMRITLLIFLQTPESEGKLLCVHCISVARSFTCTG